MSWKKEIKKYYRTNEDRYKRLADKQRKEIETDARKKRTARQHLEEDLEDVRMELENLIQDMGSRDFTAAASIREMEELSKALGKVSALLQKWL